jgi:hypothetical protein
MSFVFICIDKGTSKRLIVERVQEWGIPFIDVGMGIQLGENNTLGGIITVTTCAASKRDHVRSRTAFSDGEAVNEYSQNVQISELNALNAALAVIKMSYRASRPNPATMVFCSHSHSSGRINIGSSRDTT